MKRSPPTYTSSIEDEVNSNASSDYSPSPLPPIQNKEEVKPSVNSSSPKSSPKKTKTPPGKSPTKKTPSPKKVKSDPDSKSPTINGIWDGEKRALFIDEIINAGYKNVNLDELASKLGMSKRQLVDQLTPNKNNLRGKMIMVAKGM